MSVDGVGSWTARQKLGGKSLHAVPCFAKHALTGKEGAGDYKCEFLSADTFT